VEDEYLLYKLIREAMETEMLSNIVNGKDGLLVRRSWKPLTHSLNERLQAFSQSANSIFLRLSADTSTALNKI
jgi:hypothetical protein